MSKRLNEIIARNQKDHKISLSVFVTAGYPALDDTLPILSALAESGVDFIELGIPFSDPIADGPVIQEASATALRNGATLDYVLDTVRDFRRHFQIPILLMGYSNPIYQKGVSTFLHLAAEAGADGLILPDLPPEELRHHQALAVSLNLDFIHLIAPNTPVERIRAIDEVSTSFLYCVAYTGVTGQKRELTPQAQRFFLSLKEWISHPLFIGFGIRTREDVVLYAPYCDGVIVGTAFIRALKANRDKNWQDVVEEFMAELRPAH